MLFEPIKVKALKFRNRIVMAPMCQYSSDEGGFVKDWHLFHYASRAVGGVGLIIVEATSVDPNGRISPRDLGIWSDQHVEGLKKLTDAIHENGAKVAIQLAHAGRKSKTAKSPIAPSAIRFSEEYREPLRLDKDEIAKVVDRFSKAAKRSVLAGFDAIEIHAAHGYLVNEFLSPLTNKRNDAYGGDIERRSRFLKEIVESVKKEIPPTMPLLVRVSASDYYKGGNEVNEIIKVVNMIDGIDVVDVSGGGIMPEVHVKTFTGYQLDNAFKIKKETGLPVIGGGLVATYPLAEYAVNTKCDFVFVGRQLLRDPYWPLKIAKEAGADLEWPFQYKRAK